MKYLKLIMGIYKVVTKTQMEDFFMLPFRIYKNIKQWVPPLVSEVRVALDVNKDPFWRHAERELFIFKSNGETLGRIAAIIDHNYIKHHNEGCGFFGFFECIDLEEVSRELLNAVETYLKEKGMKKMIGPMNPSTNSELGFLYDGYDYEPYLMMPYTQVYYHKLMENNGLKKVKDLYAIRVNKDKDLKFDRLKELAMKFQKRNPEIKIRGPDFKKFESEVKNFVDVYNDAWADNWGFVPWTYDEFYWMCKNYKNLIETKLICIANHNDRPIGITIGLPNYNVVLKHLNGQLGLIGVLKFLWYKRKINTFRTLVMGVKKDFQKSGAELMMLYHLIKDAIEAGYVEAECSWILEDNISMIRVCESIGGKIYKTYRIYGKEL